MTFAGKVATAPESPGVYLLKDAKGRVLYVGKARVLRERLQAYTQPKEDPRLRSLVSKVADLETVITRSERTSSSSRSRATTYGCATTRSSPISR